MEAVGKLMPNCKNVTFPENSHWMYMEDPEKFNATVLEFIEAHSETTP